MHPLVRTIPLGVALAWAFLAGCSSEKEPAKGQLMLSVQSDMSIPKDVDEVYLEISVYGSVLFSGTYPVGPEGVKIPATLALVAGNDPASPATIRVAARQNGRIRVLREVITTVPADRIALLRIPIQWLCDGQALEDSPGQIESTCPEEQTCVAGRCEDRHIDSASFPAYRAEDVYGGAPGPDLAGQCLDTLACFSQGYLAPVRFTDCSIEKPLGGVGINVAVWMAPGRSGICNDYGCLVPLDAQGEGGYHEQNGRLMLAPALCDRLTHNQAKGIAVTTACATKTSAMPTCGPWSSVQSSSSEDGGAWDGGLAELDSSVEAEASVPEAGPEDAPSDVIDDAAEEDVDGGAGCVHSSDCPGQDTPCERRVCQSGACIWDYTPANSELVSQTQGDCQTAICDGAGNIASRVEDTDLPNDQTVCTVDRCDQGTPLHDSQPPGFDCNEGTGHFCDGDGHCVECRTGSDCSSLVCENHVCQAPSCSDGVTNGDESATDCGGSCAKCRVGEACHTGDDCLTGQCPEDYCSCPFSSNAAPMVPVDNGRYCIDATEVTRAQYEDWIMTEPSTGAQVSNCRWNNSFWDPNCSEDSQIYHGANEMNHPQTCVDWCDARAYCEAVGKRLCGQIGGGAAAPSGYSSVDHQWERACSAAGVNLYPYGNTYQDSACVTGDNPNTLCAQDYCTTMEVGAFSGCQSSVPAFAGVFDMTGNAVEWVDDCSGTSGATDPCRGWGGDFLGSSNNTCGLELIVQRNTTLPGLGFRCCSQ